MAKQTISRGTTANDGTGDTPYAAVGKINDNFTEVYNAIRTYHYKVSNLTANTLNTIAGSGFTDPITAEPILIKVYDSGQEVQGAILSYVQNGSYYDIKIYVTDSFTNAKIKVLC